MATVSEGSKTARFGFIKEHREEFGIRYLCKWLNVSPAGFYKWHKREVSAREKKNRHIAQRIRDLYVEHRGNYGSPRIHACLRQEGEVVNRKRVERLMRDMGLVGKAGRLYRRQQYTTRIRAS